MKTTRNLLLLSTCLLAAAQLTPGTTHAASADSKPSPAESTPHEGSLTGDWGGLRTDWENHGVTIGAAYTGDIAANWRHRPRLRLHG